jgi:predicted transcriptional regulator
VPSGTAAAVAYWYRRHPQMHPAEIADRIGRSERTVRRHWPPRPTLANGESRPIPAEQHLGLEQGGQIAHS